MRFGAFVMTFNRPDILRSTLRSILEQTQAPERILVVDNGEAGLTLPVVQEFDAALVTYHSMGENTGPAGATAYALRRLAQEQFDWIYWVDDDDPPPASDTLERLLRLAEAHAAADLGGVGMVGSRFDWRVGEMRRLHDDELTGVIDVDVIAGNQQLILSRRMVDAVGVADSRLFFGLYEPEYCLRIRRAGYRLLVDGGMMLEQRRLWDRLGDEIHRAVVPDYAPSRIWQRYYRTRNYIFMMRRTFGRPDLARREAVKGLVRTGTVWTRGWSYGIAFVPLQLRAIADGYGGHMGRTVAPTSKYLTSDA